MTNQEIVDLMSMTGGLADAVRKTYLHLATLRRGTPEYAAAEERLREIVSETTEIIQSLVASK